MKPFRQLKHFTAILILSLLAYLFLPGTETPALANVLGTELELTLVPAASLGVLAVGGYWLWKNRLQPQDHGKLGYRGPGEFYFGAFGGVSLVNSNNWSWEPILGPYNNIQIQTAEKNVKTDLGPVGGLKAGYFFDSIPYLGLEGEGSIASNYRPRQQVAFKPPISIYPVYSEEQGNLIWTMALHFMFRYGFLQDKEVPFGRLQPYFGIGPGVAVLYFQNDSCKNFSLDGEVGVRYYFTPKIVALVEFKYIKQWDVELGVQHVTTAGTRWIEGKQAAGKNVHFDFDNQKIVVGLEYHF
jgi:opacity protein-like surface antigen